MVVVGGGVGETGGVVVGTSAEWRRVEHRVVRRRARRGEARRGVVRPPPPPPPPEPLAVARPPWSAGGASAVWVGGGATRTITGGWVPGCPRSGSDRDADEEAEAERDRRQRRRPAPVDDRQRGPAQRGEAPQRVAVRADPAPRTSRRGSLIEPSTGRGADWPGPAARPAVLGRAGLGRGARLATRRTEGGGCAADAAPAPQRATSCCSTALSSASTACSSAARCGRGRRGGSGRGSPSRRRARRGRTELREAAGELLRRCLSAARRQRRRLLRRRPRAAGGAPRRGCRVGAGAATGFGPRPAAGA